METLPTPEFLKGVERLVGGRAVKVKSLGGEAFAIVWADHRETVLKGVPRQERESWRPGEPWTELVASDLLTATDGPAPRLLAADLTHGWLLREFAPGTPLDAVGAHSESGDTGSIFSALHSGLERVHRIFEADWPDLKPFDATPTDDLAALSAGVRRLLPSEAQPAWDELTRLAAAGPRSPGPLDVRPANAIWNGTSVQFLDLATIGFDYKERRLVAYAQSAGQTWCSHLTAEAYAAYAQAEGQEAAFRLAYFDLMFWALVYARLVVLEHRAESTAGQVLHNVWGDPAMLRPKWYEQWVRPRVPDARVKTVVRALSTSNS